jgi:hypothetical protein
VQLSLRPGLFLKAVEIAYDFRRDGSSSGFGIRRCAFLETDLGQFTGIEPVACAIRAFIHFDASLGAEVVAL